MRTSGTGLCLALFGCLACGDTVGDRKIADGNSDTISQGVDHDGAWHLVEDLRIDGNEEVFSVPNAFLLIRRDGGLMFADRRAYQLRAYDRLGRHLFNFGRRGSGPGEFTPAGRISGMDGGMVGDTAWVHDPIGRRITYVDGEGGFAGAIPAPRTPGIWVADAGRTVGTRFKPLAVYPDGRVLGERSAVVSTQPEDIRSDVVVVDPGPATVQSLAVLGAGRTETLVDQRTGSTYSVPVGGASTRVGVSQDGSRIALVEQRVDTIPVMVSLLVLTPEGDTISARTFPIAEDIQLPPVAEDFFVAALQRDMRGARASEGRPAYSADFIDRVVRTLRERSARVRAPIMKVVVGLDDTIWLVIRPADNNITYLVLDTAGDSIGVAVAPVPYPRIITAAGSRRHLWAVVSDEDGVPSIVRYRIVRP